MKKIIRVLFFAFALVLFTGTVNAAGLKVNINYYDNMYYKDTPLYTDSKQVSDGGSKTIKYAGVITNNKNKYSYNTTTPLVITYNGVTPSEEYYFIKYVDENGTEIKDGYKNEDVLLTNVVLDSTNSLKFVFRGPKADETFDGDLELKVYMVLEKKINPSFSLSYVDYVSTGSGSWADENGGAYKYAHTFKDPSLATPKSDYQFLYWQFVDDEEDDQIDTTKEYVDGDMFTYSYGDKGNGWKKDAKAYAWWQPAVYLNLYSDNKIISEQKDFEKVSIDTTPTKYGYKFLGWYDAEGNKVEDTTFYAAEKGTNPEVRTYNLYAKWERIMVDVNVSVVWDDNNNEDGVRPESVEVELKDGEEVVETVTLSEENQWTHTFNVPKYSEESEIEYTVSQNEVEYYVTTTTGSVEEGFILNNFHEVWPKGQGGDDFEVVQTGNEINYSLLLIVLFVELLFVKRKLFN